VLRLQAGATLDYEKSRTHFVTVVAKVTEGGTGEYPFSPQFLLSWSTVSRRPNENQGDKEVVSWNLLCLDIFILQGSWYL
jgi:hypothetical protein